MSDLKINVNTKGVVGDDRIKVAPGIYFGIPSFSIIAKGVQVFAA